MQTIIVDFGEKIGGAKKDLAREYVERIELITDDILSTKPLSQVFPCPNSYKMFHEGLIDAEKAIKLRYLYETIEKKPAKRGLDKWVSETRTRINLIHDILKGENAWTPLFHADNYFIFVDEMTIAEWPQNPYERKGYHISKSSWSSQFYVAKGKRAKFYGDCIADCVNWIKENSGAPKTMAEIQFVVYRYTGNNGETLRRIVPKGKKNFVLIDGLTSREAAFNLIRDRKDMLKKIYDLLRAVPAERRETNNIRVGRNHREGKNITPEQFRAVFPFRGVEFGNWVNQYERSTNLNAAYDALYDLANALGIPTVQITFNNSLALAFGARGSGKFSAHYETMKRVINLTKTRGAGSLAHEWFHGLDNHIMIAEGSPMLYAMDSPNLIEDLALSKAIYSLNEAIYKSDFYTRSAKIDELKTKKYWATKIELAARGFEKYIIWKLKQEDFENDYLANIVSYEAYGRNDTYPYPTDEEIEVLAPFYEEFLTHALKRFEGYELKKPA